MDIKVEEKIIKSKKNKLFYLIFLAFFVIFSSFLLISCGKENIPLENITLSKSEVTLFKGQTLKLYVNLFPENANNFTINWQTSNKDIATVSRTGMVTTKDYGEVVISANVKDSDISASCTINVTDGEIVNFSIKAPIKVYYEGQTFDKDSLKVYAVYESGEEKQLDQSLYTADIPEILTIDSEIKVTCENYGTKSYFPLVIEDYVKGIEVTTMPTKTSYVIGEEFDDSGMEISNVFASGKKEKILDYTIDTQKVGFKQNKVTITSGDFTANVEISTRAQITVDTITKLKWAIQEGYTSIMIAEGSYNFTEQIVLSSTQNILIFGENEVSLNGYDTIPIKIEGNCGNVMLADITFSTIGENPASYQIDLSLCQSGEIILQNVGYTSILQPEEVGYQLKFL